MSEQKVRAYMREEIKEHVGLDTLEVSCATLAESACQHFDAYGPAPEYKIPEDYFDWAVDVEEENPCAGCGNQGSSAMFGHLPPGSGLNLCRDVCLAGRR